VTATLVQENVSRYEGCTPGTVAWRWSAISTLSVQRGQVVALLGPNGAGKTTILQTVAGLLPAISGEITVVDSRPRCGAPYLAAPARAGPMSRTARCCSRA